MIYEIMVTIQNSPTKVKGWGYLIKSESKEQAIEQALKYAKNKANAPYSRYKKCTFSIDNKDVKEKPNW